MKPYHARFPGGGSGKRLHRRPSAWNAIGIRPAVLLPLPIMAGLVFLVLPLVALVIRAVSEQGLAGITAVLTNDLFIGAMERTLLLSLVVAAACCIIGTVYSIALVASPPAISKVLLAVLFSTFWVSILVRTFGWVLIFQPNGALEQYLRAAGLISEPLSLLQTTLAMYPAMIHVMLPFFILPVYASCLRLNPDLLRAAESLGGTPFAVLRSIVVPHIRPAMTAGISIVFLMSLAFYVTPLLLGGPRNLTVATLIDREFSQLYDLGSAATMAVILLAVVLVLYLLSDRILRLMPVRDGES